MQLRDRVMRRRRDRHTQPLVVVTTIIKVAGVTLTKRQALSHPPWSDRLELHAVLKSGNAITRRFVEVLNDLGRANVLQIFLHNIFTITYTGLTWKLKGTPLMHDF